MPYFFKIAFGEFDAGLDHLAAVAHEQVDDFTKGLHVMDFLDLL